MPEIPAGGPLSDAAVAADATAAETTPAAPAEPELIPSWRRLTRTPGLTPN